MGLLSVVYDGVKALVTPDCAMCIVEGENINNMDACPLRKCRDEYECDPDCEYYTEDWD